MKKNQSLVQSHSVVRRCGPLCLLIGMALFGCAVSKEPNLSDGLAGQASTPVPAPSATGSSTPTPSPTQPIAAEDPEFDVRRWLDERAEGESSLGNAERRPAEVKSTGQEVIHAAIVATLEPGRTLARENPDVMINPASLIKLATSLVALKELKSDFRFDVRVHADGVLKKDGLFQGDLYFSGSNPILDDTSAKRFAEALAERGIKRLSGKVYVSPDFTYIFRESPDESASLFVKALGLKKVPETAVADAPKGTELFIFRSQRLDRILLYMNSVSSNFVAHRIADRFGGPDRIRRFLVDELGLPPAEVKLETASGLGDNGMTARGIFAVIRELDKELGRQGLRPVDIMAIATERTSTLARRLENFSFEPATVAKTGTLSARDGGPGIAGLAGIAYGKDGPIVFVLMSEGAEVAKHKVMQDDLLKEVLTGRAEPVLFDIATPRDVLQPSETELVSSNDVRRDGR